MTPLLLDTHAWLWLAAGDARLAPQSARLRRAAAAGELLLATVSLYEAARIGVESEQGRRKGKQAMFMRPTVSQWMRDAVRETRVVPVALDAEMALDAAAPHTLHHDPFDRLIVATAVQSQARLVTADEKILAFAKVASVSVLAL